jgi:hypothetical protein
MYIRRRIQFFQEEDAISRKKTVKWAHFVAFRGDRMTNRPGRPAVAADKTACDFYLLKIFHKHTHNIWKKKTRSKNAVK